MIGKQRNVKGNRFRDFSKLDELSQDCEQLKKENQELKLKNKKLSNKVSKIESKIKKLEKGIEANVNKAFNKITGFNKNKELLRRIAQFSKEMNKKEAEEKKKLEKIAALKEKTAECLDGEDICANIVLLLSLIIGIYLAYAFMTGKISSTEDAYE